VVDFVGVSQDPNRGIASGGSGLYEFWTDSDVPVRLHDANFCGFEYRLRPRPSLTARFRYDDPEFPPAEAVSTPVIEIHFDDVHIRHWEDDEQALTEPSEYHGQVSAFDHDGEWFDLQTFTLRLAFTAERVQVTLSANEHGP
jgi:hypothetical protein